MSQPIRLTDEPMTWVMTGDSITQGVFHTHGARCWVEHVHERVRFQLGRLDDVVINTGMSGWTAPQVLDRFDHLVGRFEPDVVSISLGTNDAMDGADGIPRFRQALSEIVTRATDLGAQVTLQTPALITAGAAAAGRPDMTAYGDVAREVATTYDVLLVDHEGHWQDHFGDEEPVAWLDDPIHPNAAGHEAMARHMLRTVGLGDLG
ncbi:SGNH/GDSL hydrolase family protein [Luteipulveratus mongoliensis]|uniref:SGNH hydrolase-type esterase domain-containing protein n=1 Tax=Luteipulveratus mongoliensis TaxID=571913 RepID=A0A0K1JFY4_9MICO|nr:SGNH/GDSL hydrolase family protein [Luteipulveratus mongoliensis]AKU15614.1 hypothetical protein VV02_06690 [Luteipulveratus mongoliensis]